MSKRVWTHPSFPGNWTGTTTSSNVKGYYEQAFHLFLYKVDKKNGKIITTINPKTGKKVKLVGKVKTFESFHHALGEGWSKK